MRTSKGFDSEQCRRIPARTKTSPNPATNDCSWGFIAGTDMNIYQIKPMEKSVQKVNAKAEKQRRASASELAARLPQAESYAALQICATDLRSLRKRLYPLRGTG